MQSSQDKNYIFISFSERNHFFIQDFQNQIDFHILLYIKLCFFNIFLHNRNNFAGQIMFAILIPEKTDSTSYFRRWKATIPEIPAAIVPSKIRTLNRKFGCSLNLNILKTSAHISTHHGASFGLTENLLISNFLLTSEQN